MKDSLELNEEFAVPATMVYAHWMSSEGHSRMTGGMAEIVDEVGTEYTAWDGYISGRNLELESGRKIVQTWRSTEFDKDDEDSLITVTLEPKDSNSCVLHMVHSNIPEGQGARYKSGWVEHYFTPMHECFEQQ